MLLTAQTGFVAALLLVVIAVNHSARGQGRGKDSRLVLLAALLALTNLFAAAQAITDANRLWTGLFWASAGLLPVTSAAMVRRMTRPLTAVTLGRIRWAAAVFAVASVIFAFTPWTVGEGTLGFALRYGFGLGIYGLLLAVIDQLRVAARRAQNPTDAGRHRLMWIGASLSLGLNALGALMGDSLLGLGTMAPVVLIGYTSATLMRERLLDSQELIVRGAIFGTITAIITTIYSLLVVAFRQQGATFVFATIVSSGVLVLLFEPLRAKTEATFMRWMMAGTTHLTEACFRARDGIRRSVEMNQMLDTVIVELHGKGVTTGAAIYLLDPSEQFLGLAAYGGERPVARLWVRDAPELFSRLRAERSPLSRVTIERERRRRADWIGRVTAAEDAQVANLTALIGALTNLGADLLLPIVTQTQVIGVMTIVDDRRPEGYTPVERAALSALAGRLGIGLSNTRHADQLRLRDRLATLGEMSAGLAHEIRNPLGSIKGAAQLLETTDELSEDSREMMQIIRSEVDHLNAVVQGFLDYARPNQLMRSSISPRPFLETAQRQLGVDELDISGEPADIAIDPDRVLQVLRNLTRNAKEAAPEHPVVLAARDRGDQLIIEVLDRGPGIARELREQLFTPFVTSKSGGTGLGLAISQRIVKDHRGRIQIVAREGGGTVARIVLPRLPTSASSDTEPPGEKEQSS